MKIIRIIAKVHLGRIIEILIGIIVGVDIKLVVDNRIVGHVIEVMGIHVARRVGIPDIHFIVFYISILGRRVIRLINIKRINVVHRTGIANIVTNYIYIVIIIEVVGIIIGIGRIHRHPIIQHLDIINVV